MDALSSSLSADGIIASKPVLNESRIDPIGDAVRPVSPIEPLRAGFASAGFSPSSFAADPSAVVLEPEPSVCTLSARTGAGRAGGTARGPPNSGIHSSGGMARRPETAAGKSATTRAGAVSSTASSSSASSKSPARKRATACRPRTSVWRAAWASTRMF